MVNYEVDCLKEYSGIKLRIRNIYLFTVNQNSLIMKIESANSCHNFVELYCINNYFFSYYKEGVFLS
jgi:hypothetical protein